MEQKKSTVKVRKLLPYIIAIMLYLI